MGSFTWRPKPRFMLSLNSSTSRLAGRTRGLCSLLPSARRLRLQRIPVGSAERGVVGLDCFFKIKIGGEDADAGVPGLGN